MSVGLLCVVCLSVCLLSASVRGCVRVYVYVVCTFRYGSPSQALALLHARPASERVDVSKHYASFNTLHLKPSYPRILSWRLAITAQVLPSFHNPTYTLLYSTPNHHRT